MKLGFYGFYVHKKYFQWRAAEVLCCLFAVFGMITATLDYEQGYSPDRTHDNCFENPNQLLRYLTLFFTVVSIFLLGFRHYLKANWYSMRSNTHSKKRLFSFKFLIEVVILLIFPYPEVHGSFTYRQSLLNEKNEASDNRISLCYTYSELLYFFMFGRIFFMFRTLVNYTPYQDNHARTHCVNYKTKANFRFSIKSMFQAHSFFMISFCIFPSFLLFGVFLRIFERPYTDVSGKNYDSLENAVWNSFVTMSTIGYGDLSPSTFPGRCVAVLCSMWGAYAFSMLVFTMRKALELNANQVRALALIKQTRTAGKVICAFMAYCLAKKRRLSGAFEWKALKLALKRFQFNLKRIKSLKRNIGFKEIISKQKIKSLESRLKALNIQILTKLSKQN